MSRCLDVSMSFSLFDLMSRHLFDWEGVHLATQPPLSGGKCSQIANAHLFSMKGKKPENWFSSPFFAILESRKRRFFVLFPRSVVPMRVILLSSILLFICFLGDWLFLRSYSLTVLQLFFERYQFFYFLYILLIIN